MKVPGTMNKQSQLTVDAVVDCRKREREGESITFLARAYGVSRETMRRAVRGETWGWVEGVTDSRNETPRERQRQLEKDAQESLEKFLAQQSVPLPHPGAQSELSPDLAERIALYKGDRD